jgi:hypothetical protein
VAFAQTILSLSITQTNKVVDDLSLTVHTGLLKLDRSNNTVDAKICHQAYTGTQQNANDNFCSFHIDFLFIYAVKIKFAAKLQFLFHICKFFSNFAAENSNFYFYGGGR